MDTIRDGHRSDGGPVDGAMSTGTETGQRRRRRVRLIPVRSIPVEFAGERAGEGPLTLGQFDVYRWTSLLPDHPYAILYTELPVPAVVSVADVAGAAAVLIARHESLRTTYVPGEPPRQRVAASGVQMLEVVSLGAGQWGPQDRPAVAGALVRWLRESSDPGLGPVRIAMAIAPDACDGVIACAAGLTHVAVDHGAIEILKRDFAGLVGHSARTPAGPPGHQPLDQAELEATPAERRRADAALAHLRDHFRRMPHCLYALPGTRASGESLAVELSSAAAAMAVQRVAARTRTSRSSIVLAAICAVVARRANYQELVFPLVSSNRFERHLVNYVGALSQGATPAIEITGRSFDELVRHTWTTVMEANRLARYDIAKRDALDELIRHERGLRLNFDPFFNDVVAESWSGLTAHVGFQPEEISNALARTELRWRPMPDGIAQIRFSLSQVDGCLRLDAWSGDTGLLPRAELESLLLAIERLLTAAAHGDLADRQLPALIGLQPIPATPDRILIDHCWVHVTDVQHLIDQALAPAVARVYASAAGRPLVAYLTATDTTRTPQQAHAQCLAALEHHPTAITPRHYIICATAPTDPADPAAWPPPLATGTGRE
jgi:hypothetical protein